jgi:6,7-dimethyl-8-ribityllumazine synthase
MATENKNLSEYDKATMPNASEMRFGIVVSEWNEVITGGLAKGAIATLEDLGCTTWERYDVPGSFELIHSCKLAVESGQFDCIIAIGSVIRGETAHFDYVCSGVTQGIKDLNILGDVPVIFCVLTDDTMEQSLARSGGKHGNKGVEAAVAGVKMVALKQQFFP